MSLKTAEKRLQDFLKNNPRAQKMQKEINKVLSVSKDPVVRFQILADWMRDNYDIISEKISEISKIINKND